jgi:hypothetical protein
MELTPGIRLGPYGRHTKGPAILVLVAASLLVLHSQDRPRYAPPVASAAVLKGIDFASGALAGDQFRKRFTTCDSSDTCDGKLLKFGCSKDPNRNTVMLKLSGNVVFFDGKMGVDADGSPLSQKTPGVTDQPQTSFRYPSSGNPSVDSDKVPFIVIPGGGFAKALGVEFGDIAAVVYKDRIAYALVADQGPACKLGEGSMELHKELGHTVCIARDAANECTKLRNAGIERDVLYFIFLGSRSKIINGLNPGNINNRLSVEGAGLMSTINR